MQQNDDQMRRPHTRHRPAAFAVFVLVAALLALVADAWLSPLLSVPREVSSGAEQVDMPPGATPLAIDIGDFSPQAFDISFEALATDDYFDNYFQSANANGIGLELQHPGLLYFRILDAYLPVAATIELNRYYDFRVVGGAGKATEVYVDGALALKVTDPVIIARRVNFDRFLVGSGLADQRRLQGDIRNLEVKLSGTTAPWWARPLLAVVGALAALAFGFIGARWFGLFNLASQDRTDATLGPALLASACFVVLTGAGLALGDGNIGVVKWTGSVVALVLIAIFGATSGWLRGRRVPVWTSALVLFAVMIALGTVLWNGIDTFNASRRITVIWSAAMALSATAFALPRLRRSSAIPGWELPGRLVTGALLSVGLFVAFIAQSHLQNWHQIANAIDARPLAGAFFAVLGALAALAAATSVLKGSREQTPTSVDFPRRVLAILPYLVFAFLAFRSDMLFLGSSELHWEYYAGVVRTLRSGGWLLGEAPSQYGTLGLLLAALVPGPTSWDGFFVFHALLLLAAASLFLEAAVRFCGVPRMLAFVLVTFTVFLAYPGLIEPTPYPSSGPMRFIWVYALLFWACASFRGEGEVLTRFTRLGAVLWGLGLLWSAESAIYATAVYFAPIGLHLVTTLTTQFQRRRLFIAELVLPILPGAIALAGFILPASLVYRMMHGAWPDWSMHFMYGFAYASGFGGLPVPANGPIWILMLVLAIGVLSVFQFDRTDRAATARGYLAIAATSAIWAISSYYVGRAVPNNIVAIFPLIAFSVITLLRSWPPNWSRVPALAVTVPVLAVAFASPPLNDALFLKIGEMRLPSGSVALQVRRADEELTALVEKAGISVGDAVVYYGYEPATPVVELNGQPIVFDRTWLPTPLQLLEEPVPPARREQILARMADQSDGGFLIQKHGQAEDRFAQWLDLLRTYFKPAGAWDSENYSIYSFEPRSADTR